MRISMMLAGVLLVSACSGGTLEALREAPLPDDPYQATLVVQYLTLADAAAGEQDWDIATRFADKGMTASVGKEVLPDAPSSEFSALVAAERALTGAMTPKTRTDYPKALANAVVFFDCWVAYAARKDGAAALCEEGFNDALAAMSGKSAAPMAAAGVPEDVALSTSYLIFFGWDQAALNQNAQKAIQKLLAYVKQLKNTGYEVIVNGHTDTSGDEMYNLTLSNARADVVKESLIAAGLLEEKITTYGFGESDPRVATPDGVREPANRRVEIFIE